ncbi:MAG: MFS transporter [Chloroflexota bacterium]
MNNLLFKGFRGFVIMWLGQFVSLIGTSMTRFALTIWAYETTGSATALALVGFFSFGPVVLLSPLAGALVDRWPRKTILIISDLGAGVATMLLLSLLLTGQLEMWHLYVAGAIAGAFESFQFPAFSAAITMMVDKDQYARTSAMQGVAESASTIIAPILAGILLTQIDLIGIMFIDVVTFIIAMGTLSLIFIPQPVRSQEGEASQSSLKQEVLYGFSYIWQRPSLLGMQLIFTLANLTFTFGFILLAPLVLSMTNNDEIALGTVQTAVGVGGLLGGIILSIWGGPKRKVHGVLLGMFFSGLLGQVLVGFGSTVLLWAIGVFLMMFFGPLINSSNQAIWQLKVPPDVQGRVFSVRRLIAQITGPIAMLLAGPLADQVFEPAMLPGGALAPLFGGIFGTAPGSGIRLIFVITGFLAMIVGALGYVFPVVRNIETILPDYEAVAQTAVAEDASEDHQVRPAST